MRAIGRRVVQHDGHVTTLRRHSQLILVRRQVGQSSSTASVPGTRSGATPCHVHTGVLVRVDCLAHVDCVFELRPEHVLYAYN